MEPAPQCNPRRIAFKVQPVSRTPSRVKRLRTKFATRLVMRLTNVSLRCARYPQTRSAPREISAEQARDIGRIILQVAIDQDRDLAADRLQTSENSRALSGVFFKAQNPDPRIGCDAGTSFVAANHRRQK